jgi:hypothetical protein
VAGCKPAASLALCQPGSIKQGLFAGLSCSTSSVCLSGCLCRTTDCIAGTAYLNGLGTLGSWWPVGRLCMHVLQIWWDSMTTRHAVNKNRVYAMSRVMCREMISRSSLRYIMLC